MFDIGWQELFVIAAVTIVVVGPKELPHILRTMFLWVRKAREIARDFHNGLNDIVNEAGLEDIKEDAKRAAALNFQDEIEKVIDPGKEVAAAFAPEDKPDNAPKDQAPKANEV